MEEISSGGDFLNPFHDIYTCVNTAYRFMVTNRIIRPDSVCPSCSSKIKVESLLASANLRGFRCIKYSCKNKRNILTGSKLEGINIQLNKILRVFYCYVFDYSNVQAVNFCQISEPSYIKIKELIIKTVPNETKKIGGEGLEVQIDETAICNGLIIKNPSSTLDDKKNVQWIVGGVDNSEAKNFFLTLVPNRKISTLLDVFEKNIMNKSILITDGYPSYPSAVAKFGSDHKIVNHSEGFCNADGINTNSIENIWSHLKKDYRERSGVKKERITLFLKEFQWKKQNLKKRERKILLEDFFY